MDLSLANLNQALEIRQQIEGLEKRLAALFTDSAETRTDTVRRKRTMSADARARIAAAARARWAKSRQDQEPASTTSPAARKGGLTPAGRKKRSQAMKARWAARTTSASGK